MKVSFYEGWASFPHTRDSDNYIGVSVDPERGPAANYEFMLTEVGSGPGWRERIALRAEIFSDAWEAFEDLPELFVALRRSGDMSTSEARALLSSLGYTDKTADYEQQHEHLFTCSCGARQAVRP